jgi:hypothetical protein
MVLTETVGKGRPSREEEREMARVLEQGLGPADTPMRCRLDTVASLLACGIGYSVVYLVTNYVIAGCRYSGHNRVEQRVLGDGSVDSPVPHRDAVRFTALMIA